MFKLSALFILLTAITGYLFLERFPKQRLKLSRTSGYHTFFLSAAAGFALFILSCCFFLICELIVSAAGCELYTHKLIHTGLNIIFANGIEALDARLLELSLIQLTLLWGLPKFLLKGSNTEDLFHNAFRNDPASPEFTGLFYRSFEKGCPILFTLSDRKVYIGYLIQMDYYDFNDIDIIPFWSGYRDDCTLKLHLVTPYEEFFNTLTDEKGNWDFEKFTVTLPIREIRYAHLHDFEHFSEFEALEHEYQNQQPRKKGTKNSEGA